MWIVKKKSSEVAIKEHRKEVKNSKMANYSCRCETINSAGYATPLGLYFFAKNLPKFEKRWVKPGKNGEISGRDESL
jgi:hypothetical protein